MIYNPHPYQEYATQRIVDAPRVGLFLGVGLGKTVITLSAIVKLKAQGEARKVLIIAPLNVAKNTWATEAEKWEHTKHLTVSKVLGDARTRAKALDVTADIYIINRENVPWIVDYCGVRWPFDTLMIDELSSFKSYQAVRFKKLKTVLPKIKRLVGLTATPCSNGLIDLWPQIFLLDNGERLGKYVTHYRETYFLPDQINWKTGQTYSWKPRQGAEKTIYSKISDICISMSAKDYLSLPPRIDRVVNVELPEDARRKYAQLGKELLLPLGESDIEAGSAAILAGKLLQMSNGAIYDEHKAVHEIHTAKLEALTDIVEAANGHPLLIFYTFRHDAQRITEHLKAAKYPVTALKSEDDVTRWNRGEIPILLAHPASAGHGLNLQSGGNVIVWYGLPWSLELYAQGNGRLHRQGQEQPVIVYHLMATGTIDEDVVSALRSKATGQAALLAAVKARLIKQAKTA
jgi:SNF2 family DNA or RNA helicase